MTILNNDSDGLPPELIVLFRAIMFEKNISINDAIDACRSPNVSEKRLRGALTNWENLGLFKVDLDKLTVNPALLENANKVTINQLTDKLPSITRQLLMKEENCLPLWSNQPELEKGVGRAADLVRALSWYLAQDIFTFPIEWDAINKIESEQLIDGKRIFSSDFRFNAFRPWMRYLGFATGEGSEFQIDPTIAIKDCLPRIFSKRTEIGADEFVRLLHENLPVFDFGLYRKELELNLNPSVWRKPTEKHLSTSLSFALKRLEGNKTIQLKGRADTGSGMRLTGQKNRTWGGFEAIIFLGE
jgi:hypothetical protein